MIPTPHFDYDKLSRNSLALFVKELHKVISELHYDLILAGGDSGNIMAWITNVVYEMLQVSPSQIVTLPIYRHADYAETVLFDNKILSPQIQLVEGTLKNILIVDDEVGIGNTVKGLLDALGGATSEKPSVTFIAEDDGFDASKIIGWNIDFRPPQVKVKDIYNAVSYIIPQEYELPVRKVLEPIVEDTNDKHIMATLLNLPIKEYNDGQPEFTFKYRDKCLEQIDNFESLQKDFQDFIRTEISKVL